MDVQAATEISKSSITGEGSCIPGGIASEDILPHSAISDADTDCHFGGRVRALRPPFGSSTVFVTQKDIGRKSKELGLFRFGLA